MRAFSTFLALFCILSPGFCIEATSSIPFPAISSPSRDIIYNNPKIVFFVLKTVEEILEERASLKRISFSLNDAGDEADVQFLGTTDPPNPNRRRHSLEIQSIYKLLQQQEFIKDLVLVDARRVKYVNIAEHGFGWEFRIDFKIIVEKCKRKI